MGVGVDIDCTFLINLYQAEDIEDCLTALRQAYPTHPCVLITDGDGWDYSAIARRYNCQLIEGERLKAIGGGFWTERFLDWFAVFGKTQWLIKIDPDTEIVRPLTVFPPKNGLFGYEYRRANHLSGRSVHGGFQGFSRDAIEKILESNLLKHPRYQNQHRFWYTSRQQKLSFQDGILSDIIELLDLPVFNHPEIYCSWLTPPQHPYLWAAYHPRYRKLNS